MQRYVIGVGRTSSIGCNLLRVDDYIVLQFQGGAGLYHCAGHVRAESRIALDIDNAGQDCRATAVGIVPTQGQPACADLGKAVTVLPVREIAAHGKPATQVFADRHVAGENDVAVETVVAGDVQEGTTVIDAGAD